MTVVYQFPLTSTFAGVRSLQANGTNPSGDDSPTGNGAQISIENGWAKFQMWETDDEFGGGIRAEMTGADEDVPSMRLYRWESRFEGWDYSAEPFVVMQIHSNHDSTAYAEPVLIRCDGRQIWMEIPAIEPPLTGLTSKAVGYMPIEMGRVYKHALLAKWDKTGKGSLRWIVDGVVRFGAPLTGTDYNYTVGPYFKVGVYTGGSHTAGWGTRIQYVRNLIVTDGLNGESWSDLIGDIPRPVQFWTGA